MKKYLLIILSLSLIHGLRAQTDSLTEAAGAETNEKAAVTAVSGADLWNQANTAYINGDYLHAVALYDSLANTAGVGYKLYYNLGNAYFKMNDIGRAILYYNRAARLAPSDEDIKHNLAVANSYVKDKIEQVPEFFLIRWMRAARMALSCSSWTLISLGTLAFMLSGVILYLLSGGLTRRKAGFLTAALGLLLFILTTSFAMISRREACFPDKGIVMRSAVSVKSSPDNSSKDLFVIHEGTQVKVVGALKEWFEVTIADGNKGWIQASAIEMI